MTDKELDLLFQQSAQNKQAAEQINCQVMRIVRRDIRQKILRKWVKLLGFCFGLPLAVVAYIFILAKYMPALPQELTIVCYVIPISTIAILIGKRLHDFSLSDL